MKQLGRAGGWLFLLIFFNCQLGWAQKQATNPVPASADSAAAFINKHLVEFGDTYYQLAKKYRVPVDSLIKWNGENLLVDKVIRFTSVKSASISKVAVAKTDSVAVIVKSPVPTSANNQKPVNTTLNRAEESGENTISAHKAAQRILIIPFDPRLYFSDADDDIARQSEIPKQNVRYIFRSRLSAFLDPKGFQRINLLTATPQDSAGELRKIYKSLGYSYQKIAYSRFNPLPVRQKTQATGPKSWFQKQKEKAGLARPKEENAAEEGGKYYGVQIKDPAFFRYFNNQYSLDYYLFINQFEIHTDYTNCIDRTTQNFQREFIVHYTIFDAKGELIAGNKVKIPYVSNVNDLNKIVRDNLNKMAEAILSDLPQPQVFSSDGRRTELVEAIKSNCQIP